MSLVWTIVVGFFAGLIARFLMPGRLEAGGIVMTTVLGVIGAIVATYAGQGLGWYAPGEAAGLIGAVVGALIVLFLYGRFAVPPSRR